MIRALIRKELRDLRPWAALSIAIGLADIAVRLTRQVDMQPLAHTFSLGDAAPWLVGFALGTGVTTREQDDGTLAFLDGLPVSRSAIFATKCGVVVALVMLAPLVHLVSIVVLHLLSRGSLDRALHLELLLSLLAIQTLLCCNAVCLGAALGRLRSLTWLMTGVAATGLGLLTERLPRARLFNPLSLLDIQVMGTRFAFDGEAVAVQAGITCIAAALAWHGFVHTRTSWLSTLSGRPAIGTLLKVFTVVALVVPLALFVKNRARQGPDEDRGADEQRDSEDEPSEAPRFAPGPPALTHTGHYRLSYPALRAQAALQLAAQADTIFERVHSLLGAELGPSIDVDLSGSMRNTEGTAFAGRIRMVLAKDAPSVLAHETAHVVCQRIAGVDRDAVWRDATVLNEGIATWVERHFDADSSDATSDELVLAALHARRELTVDVIIDSELLAMRLDEGLKYPVGAALVNAMLKLYGEPALTRLVRSFAHAALPPTLQGQPLWEATFQLAGMDLGAVLDEFYRQISQQLAAKRAAVAALPRPRVRLVRQDDMIGVQTLAGEGHGGDEPPGALSLRIKPRRESPLYQIDGFSVEADVPLWRDASDIAGGVVCVQPGIALGKRTLHEPWVCLPTRDATPWAAE